MALGLRLLIMLFLLGWIGGVLFGCWWLPLGLGCLCTIRVILVVVSCFFGFEWLFAVGWVIVLFGFSYGVMVAAA